MLLDPCKSSVLHHDGHALVTAVSHPYAVRGAGDSARDTLSRVFPGPQIVLFSRDVERLAAFYTELGFPETFRVRAHGQPIHIDVSLDSYVIGIASLNRRATITASIRSAMVSGAAVVLWTDDTASAIRSSPAGAAWSDPPLQIVQRLPKRDRDQYRGALVPGGAARRGRGPQPSTCAMRWINRNVVLLLGGVRQDLIDRVGRHGDASRAGRLVEWQA